MPRRGAEVLAAIRARPLLRNSLILALYVVVAAAGIGRHALASPSTVCACAGDVGDPPLFMWALKWWPWAITHGVNPFYTHLVWAPQGISPATMTSIPVAALALAPVTLLWGPLVSFNVMTILAPALAAFTAYRLCVRLTGRTLASMAGGYLFGFGSFVIGQSLGHGHLILVFLVPVAVELVLARARRAIGRRRFVILLTFVIVLQVGLSTEVLAASVLMGAAMLLAVAVFSRASRPLLKPMAAEIVGAGALAALVTAPYLYYELFQSSFPRGPGFGDAVALDGLNPFVPTMTTGIGYFGGLSEKFTGGDLAEATGYLALPLLAAFGAFALRDWRRPTTRVIVTGFLVAMIVALGSHLYIGGRSTIPLPWGLVDHRPLFDYMAPSRFTLFAQLALGAAVALWLADGAASPRRRAARWAVPAAGVVLLWPDTSSYLWQGHPSSPAFFRSAALYRRYVTKDSTALVIPFGASGASMLWQAETGMYFRMAGGYTGQTAPAPFDADPAVKELNGAAAPNQSDLRRFLAAHSVKTVLIRPSQAGGWTAVMASLGIPAVEAGDMLVYRISG